MTSATRQVLYIIAGIVVAVAALYGLYAIATGNLIVPDDVVTKFWAALGLGLILVMTFLQQQNANRLQERNDERAALLRANSDRNAQETQGKVETLVARVENGLGDKISSITLDKVIAAQTQKTVEDAAHKQREDVAAMKVQLEQLAILMAQRATAPLESRPSIVAPNGDPVHTALVDNTVAVTTATAATAENTQATLEDTKTRLTNLESAARADPSPAPPIDGEPKG